MGILKLEGDADAGGGFDDERSLYRFGYINEIQRVDFESDNEFNAYKRFAKEYNDSMGFDVEHFFVKRTEKLVSLKPVPLSDAYNIVAKACKNAVNSLLQFLDQKNEHNLVLVRIIKANYTPDFLFFITLEAKDKVSGEIKVYQSVIFRQLRHDKTTLHMFRDIGAIKGRVKYDCRENYSFVPIQEAKKNKFRFNKSKTQKQAATYRKYVREYNYSKGFHICHFPKGLDKLLIPVNKYLLEYCAAAVENVLKYLKSLNEHELGLVGVIKANYKQGFHFFVTFEAKCLNYLDIKEYQSIFFCHCTNGEIALHMFREKGDVTRHAINADYRDAYIFSKVEGAKESDFKSRAEFEEYQKYAKEHDDSGGFDIKNFITPESGCDFTTLVPVRESDTPLWLDCETVVKDVLNYLRKINEGNLVLVKVVKANYTEYYPKCYQFFVTFEAKVKGSEDSNEYQAVISLEFRFGHGRKTFLYMFGKKGEEPCSSEPDLVPEVDDSFDDSRDDYIFIPVIKLKATKFDSPDAFDAYEKYAQEIKDSEGFDYQTVASPKIMDWALMLNQVPPDSPLFKHCREGVEVVLHNLSLTYEENLELVSVCKANVKRRYMFFVTFEARNKISGEINNYQSVIFHTDNGLTRLHLFRKIIK